MVNSRWRRPTSSRPGPAISPRSPPPSRAPRAAADDPREVLDLTVRRAPGPHVLLDLLDAVASRRVVPTAERVADLHERQAAALAHQVHRDVPGRGQRA